MRLDQYISELLYEHECVIIPGFGGIVSNYKPAFLNPARHTFSPPSRRLAFNASLRTNDGLLASHVSRQLSVNYTQANSYINEFVNDCLNSLESGEKLVLERVGVVYLDEEKNLQFMPDASANYLKSSFGLFTLHSPPIRREEIQPVPIIPEKAIKTGKKKRIASWRFIEVIPVAAILTLMMLNPSVITSLNDQLADINPFAKAISVPVESEKEISAQTADFTAASESINENVSDDLHADENASSTIVQEEAPVIKMQPDLIAEEKVESNVQPVVKENIATAEEVAPVKPNVIPVSSTGKQYHVIGGCFREEENANNFLQQSLDNGLQAAIIGRNKAGLIMVSLFSSPDYSEALSGLEEMRHKADTNAWLYRQ